MVLTKELHALRSVTHYPPVFLPRGFRMSRISRRDDVFSYVYADEDRFIVETDQLEQACLVSLK